MNLSQEFFDFVSVHGLDDVCSLRLKYKGRKTSLEEDFPLEFALVQIDARQKARKKLPSYVGNPKFLFPSLIAAEQASNEAVARYHASLVTPASSMLDMTGGLGIDDYAFAKSGIKVTTCDIEQAKCDTLIYNSKILGLDDLMRIECADSVEYLRKSHEYYDVIFADPARRATGGQRVHALADCQPDIISNMDTIMAHTRRFFVKSSPLLDLSMIINTVNDLSHIYVVCFRGECKEVLIEISKDFSFSGVTAVDLDWIGIISEASGLMTPERQNEEIRYADRHSPTDYRFLYEPNAGVMKTGDWRRLQEMYPDIWKASPNTHLFLSDIYISNFPGRVLEIKNSPNKQELKRLKAAKLNIVSRNHPLSPAQIAKKYGVVSGGTDFLYALRYKDTPEMLILTPTLPFYKF